ncbi:SGNH/GDSL hydrolase family protein [Dysgonomonas sp. ZJ279]|uniref:SGNH/GDSL hydrolase family protein n=1 Tax=Dysgonomonas sp. ZJ279 TaxID=2709796 RepID=UPI0013EE35D0|nr:SGNH/GDSL hydrolase family protein [Dysgonomonas sp. ZJ279]
MMKRISLIICQVVFCFTALFNQSCSKDELLPEKENTVKLRDVSKYLILGNSITVVQKSSYWWGEWGMAATKASSDYVHVFNSLLENKFSHKIPYKAINIAEWEKNTNTFDNSKLNSYFDHDENLVILRIGENVPFPDLNTYEKNLTTLVKHIKKQAPNAHIVLTGNFWKSSKRDLIQYNVAKSEGCTWVALSQLDFPEYKPTLDTQVYDDEGSLHKISEGGDQAIEVINHPGDKGMKRIAELIFDAII